VNQKKSEENESKKKKVEDPKLEGIKKEEIKELRSILKPCDSREEMQEMEKQFYRQLEKLVKSKKESLDRNHEKLLFENIKKNARKS